MATKMRYTLPILAAFLFMGLLTFNTAWGAELWVTPAVDPADTEVGDWAATSAASTHFSFAVPDDFTAFVSATVVMIGKNNKDTSADVYLSISQNTLRHDDFTASVLGIPLSSSADELIELDVSAIFPILIAGSDYASLYFETKFVRVVGLRFNYNSVVAGDLAAETAQRVAGDAGLQSALDTEVAARGAGDTALQSAVNAEASARTLGDQVNKGALSVETIARTTADNALQSGLDSEAASRIAGDAANLSDLGSHAADTDAHGDSGIRGISINELDNSIAVDLDSGTCIEPILRCKNPSHRPIFCGYRISGRDNQGTMITVEYNTMVPDRCDYRVCNTPSNVLVPKDDVLFTATITCIYWW